MNEQNLSLHEQSVIGCIIIDETTLYIAREILKPDDFSSLIAQMIFKEMCNLNDNGSPVNIATVLGNLVYDPGFNNSGGIDYLTKAPTNVATSSMIVDYANQVKAASVRRKLGLFADNLKKVTGEPIDDVNELIAKLGEQLFELGYNTVNTPWKTMKTALSETCESLVNIESDSEVIHSGYVDLDAKITGFRPGALTIIAARPAMGKTAFGLNLLVNAALNSNCPVAFFSLEMTSEELVSRILSCVASINGNSIRQKHLTDDEWGRLLVAAEKYSKANVFIDETAAIDISTLRDRAKRLYKQFGIKMIIVDYLQLMKSDKKRIQNREQEVADISRTLKGIAKELHIPVISLAQLNRSLDSRADKRPVLSDLRESGSIEQDADNILFIHREDYYHPNDTPTNEAEIIIAKQRSGPTGIVKLRWEGQYTRFSTIENVFEE